MSNIKWVMVSGLAALAATIGLAGTADVDATVTNNTVRTTDNVFPPVGGADAAIQVYLSDLNLASTPQNRVCLNATGNATQANGGAFGETDFFFGNDAIPLPSRIILVADTVEAMTSDRPYRKALPIDCVISELNKYSGSQFDPACTEAFLRLLDREGECFIRSEVKFDIYEFIEG